MLDNRPVVALIPARAGSKGVVRKNLALVGGEPLLVHTLRAARECYFIDQVVVSSDGEDILSLAQQFGATALRRPEEFSGDAAPAAEVVKHFISSREIDENCLIVYLQPTSPLRTAKHITGAFELMVAGSATTLVSVLELRQSPYKSFSVDNQGRLASLFDERLSNARRQDLPRAFIPNGAIYVFAVCDFIARGGFPSNGALPYIMKEVDSVDVDTADDLVQADMLLRGKHGRV